MKKSDAKLSVLSFFTVSVTIASKQLWHSNTCSWGWLSESFQILW